MYATLHRTSGPATSDAPAAEAGSALHLRQIGGPAGLVVRFWPERPADPAAFEVDTDLAMTAAGEPPAVASVLTFTGPISEAAEAAAERAYRDRVEPGMRDHPGSVRLLSLWQPELRRRVVIALSTSLESLEEGGRKIGSMPLLPGEDVTLLPGPDHVEVFRVEPEVEPAAEPAVAPSGVTS